MSELLREIEEDIRRERLDKLWHDFGRIMVWVSVAIVLVTVGVVIWQERKQAYAEAQTGQFIRGLDRMGVEDYQGAISAFSALAADDSSPYYGLAMLRKAGAQTKLGDRDGAAATYRTLAKKNDVFGELAMMLSADNNTILPQPSPDAPLYYSLSEWRGWQLLQQGKKDEAVSLFIALRDDPNVPHSLRARIVEALWRIAPEKAQ